ncbi:MAG TPA: hypothetical protein PLD20_04490 [Blastocatellia bacterium]|nr:hypothetical protein [Blastocatellia bacterium]HMV86668.1 hypothetical protein [Blastocatellia bacterium]HMX24120.1 hypothetical protein [Blastocatellia bacterium]HMY70530.1 hypothetical protein [Blastocatellia bacterium]HMZ17165.1 hypothetical protein [Blastocatellia bacterium]
MATQKPGKEPRVDETTGKGNPDLIGQPAQPTPGQAEGDRETVEEDLRQKEGKGEKHA